MISYELARERMDHRLREAEQWRKVAAARNDEAASPRVWRIGGLVVAWSPRRRRFDPCRQETPIVVWV